MSSRIVTVPNLLSLLRLLLVPVFLWLLVAGQFGWALVMLVIASVSDYVDGVVARRFDQMTRLGQLLDPAADRLYILATLVGLGWQGLIPWWAVSAIVARDLLLVGLGALLANHGYGPLPVHVLGKAATFALLTALPTILLGAAFPVLVEPATIVGWAALLWGIYLYWCAGVAYLVQAVRLLRGSPVSAPPTSDTLGR